jgi:hypothetical protein
VHSKASAEAAMFAAPVLAAQQVEAGEVFREGVVVPVEEAAGVAAAVVVVAAVVVDAGKKRSSFVTVRTYALEERRCVS